MMDTTKMIFVGRFTEEDLIAGKNKEAVAAKKALNPGLKYIYTEDVKKGRKIVALDIYLSLTYL